MVVLATIGSNTMLIVTPSVLIYLLLLGKQIFIARMMRNIVKYSVITFPICPYFMLC